MGRNIRISFFCTYDLHFNKKSAGKRESHRLGPDFLGLTKKEEK